MDPLQPTVVSGFEEALLLPNLLATIGFSVNFYGITCTSLYVNNNGNITFGAFLWEYTPTNLVGEFASEAATGVTGIIAPFWADVDTRGPDSGLVTYGTGMVATNAAFGVSWVDVGYYYEKDNPLNLFQLVLINRPDRASGDYDVEFNYAQILWETGDASGGVNGFGGSSARAGYASTNGSTFELNGSGGPGSLLDSNLITGLIHNNFNSTNLGRYVFQFHNGVPLANP